MNFLRFFLFFLLIFSDSVFSQHQYEYFGTISLNGDDKNIISYRLVFGENKGKISGYSITDIGGNFETKNAVVGTYNQKTNQLIFKESDIIYTKSTLSADIFCFINYVGNVNLSNQNGKVSGNFKGLYINKSKCIDGKISLIPFKKITKVMTKLNSKVEKSKKFDTASKEKVRSFSVIDSLTLNKLSKGQNLNLFVASDEIEIEIWDGKLEDGDRIDLFHNNRKLLSDYTVVSNKKIIKIKLTEGNNVFKIEALNEGRLKLNTAMIRLVNSSNTLELTTNLNKGENASITIIKK